MTYDEAELECLKKMLERTDLDSTQRAELKLRMNSVYERMRRSEHDTCINHMESVIALAAYAARRLRGMAYSYNHAKESFSTVMFWTCDEMGLLPGTVEKIESDLMKMMDEIYSEEDK